jgi:hypothetical protein
MDPAESSGRLGVQYGRRGQIAVRFTVDGELVYFTPYSVIALIPVMIGVKSQVLDIMGI